MVGKGGERRFRAEIRLIDSGVRVCPAFFVVLSSIPKRNFDWETPLGIKRVCLAKVRNDDFGPKSAWEILVCVRPFFFVVLSSRVASQFPNETSCGRHHWESKEYVWQRWRTTISGRNPPDRFWCVRARLFSCCSVCSQFPNETSCGRHH